MSYLLEYKDYLGTVEYSSSDKVLYGKVIGINGLVSYEGDSIESLQADFEEAVDDYLEMCAEQGVEPQKTYKGTFNVRISPNTAYFTICSIKILQNLPRHITKR